MLVITELSQSSCVIVRNSHTKLKMSQFFSFSFVFSFFSDCNALVTTRLLPKLRLTTSYWSGDTYPRPVWLYNDRVSQESRDSANDWISTYLRHLVRVIINIIGGCSDRTGGSRTRIYLDIACLLARGGLCL
jgi:hypothetical protein